jgi:hypothetical protein
MKNREILQCALDKMEASFSSKSFCFEARKLGISEHDINQGRAAQFLHSKRDVKQDYKMPRTWHKVIKPIKPIENEIIKTVVLPNISNYLVPYIQSKHTQEECIGFIAGFEACMQYFIKKENEN